MAIGTVVSAQDLNPDQPGDESVARTSKDIQPHPIVIGTTTADSGNKGTSLTLAHTMEDAANRMLVVAALARDASAAACDVSSVTYNGVGLTKADEANAGAGPYVCSELWYLIAPATGTHDVVVTWAAQVDRRIVGATSMLNVAQQAPEATANTGSASAATITTTVTTTSTAPMLMDGLTVSSGGGRIPTEVLQTENFDVPQGGVGGAGSRRPGGEPGDKDMTWTFSSGMVAHVVAAFAEAQ